MSFVQTYVKPDIFLTMICNPNWQEIHDECLQTKTLQDRPDLVAKVFRAKKEKMKKMMTNDHIMGVVKAYVYVVDFQKNRQLLANFMLIIKSHSKKQH